MLTRETPDLAINLAAYTAVDRAESEPDQAWAVNCAGAAHIAAACGENATPLIHLSTDYVFDGRKTEPYREDDAVGPLGVYGRSKEAGERAVRAALAQHVILRTAWVFGAYGANFVKTMLRLAAERSVLRVVADQRGCPTAAADIAAALMLIAGHIERGEAKWGTYHFAGDSCRQLAPLRRNDLRSRGAATRGPSEGRADHHRPIPNAGAASDELGPRLPQDPRRLWDHGAIMAKGTRRRNPRDDRSSDPEPILLVIAFVISGALT